MSAKGASFQGFWGHAYLFMNNWTDFHRRFQSGVHDQHLSSSVASLDLEE